jgi:WD40 repeat protein/mono/diheme cytochrome c family protein
MRFPTALLLFLSTAAFAADTPVSYFRQVRPILQRNCQGCHQPAVKQSNGNLDLTTYVGFKTGGKKGPAAAVVVAYLEGKSQPRMPLGVDPLAADQIELIRKWVAAGAADDTPPEARETLAAGKPPVYRLPPVITALAWSPDGKMLAVSGYREVLLQNADGSGLVARLPGLSDRIQSVVFSADGATLVAAGGTPARFGEVQIWDVPARKLQRSVMVSADTVFGASLSPDGSKIAVGCADNTVRVIETASGKELLKMGHHENWVLGTAFGADGKRLVSVGRDRAAKLTDALSGAFVENVNLLRDELTAVARHPRRDYVLIGGQERIPYLYMMDRPKAMKIADDTTLVRKFEPQLGPIFALAFSSDGSRITAGGVSAEVPIYNTDTGERVSTCRGHQAGIYTVAFRPDGAELATAGFDGRVRLYETGSGKLVREFVPVPLEKNLVSQK